MEADLAAALKAARFMPARTLDMRSLTNLAPAGGALLLFAVASEGGMAFILPHGGGDTVGEAQTVRLPRATREAVRASLIAWDKSYVDLRNSERPDGLFATHNIMAANAVLERVLDWLWAEVMGPVLARLPDLGLFDEDHEHLAEGQNPCRGLARGCAVAAPAGRRRGGRQPDQRRSLWRAHRSGTGAG
jgi:hypothetical protein